MRDRRTALPRLVAEQAAADAPHHRHHERADAAADQRCRSEGLLEDQRHVPGKRAEVHEKNDQRSGYIQAGHCGRQDRGHLADSADAANDYQSDKGGEDQRRVDGRNAELALDLIGECIGLVHASTAERADGRAAGEQQRHPFPALAEPQLDVVHRAAGDRAIRIDLAMSYGQGALDILQRHAEEGGEPHPEERARASQPDAYRHAGDIADADRRRKGCRQRLEVLEITLILGVVVAAEGDVDSMPEAAHLDQRQPHSHEQSGAEQQHRQQRNPGFRRPPPDVFFAEFGDRQQRAVDRFGKYFGYGFYPVEHGTSLPCRRSAGQAAHPIITSILHSNSTACSSSHSRMIWIVVSLSASTDSDMTCTPSFDPLTSFVPESSRTLPLRRRTSDDSYPFGVIDLMLVKSTA